MTLFKQIIIILSILLTIVFGSVMWFNFNSSKTYVMDQSYTDALHTANSLGLAISTVASLNDVSTAETMINSVFDSGYYEKIILTDMNKKVLVSKKQKVIVAGVPNWFIKYIKIVPPVAKSQIMLGWTPYGILSVQLNSGLAYMQLWTIFKDIFSVFLIVSIVGFFLLQLILIMVLKPLKKVKEQAEAILENDFIFQEEIPFTKELKNVVLAMNSMVKKVKEIFEKEIDAVRKYHEEIYQDKTTGMCNRRYFNIKLQEYLGSEEKNAQGVLILISLNDFSGIKNSIGYQKCEIMVKEIGDFITELINQNSDYIIARIEDKDFALLAPTTSQESLLIVYNEINNRAQKIMKSFGLSEKKYYINIGYAKYYANEKAKELFSKADFALAMAKNSGPFSAKAFEDNKKQGDIFLGKEAWSKELREAMMEKRFKLAYQNVVKISDTSTIYQCELFIRLQHADVLYNAGYFMPMAKELKLDSEIDRYVLESVEKMAALGTFTCRAVCINIGRDTIMQSDNYSKLEDAIVHFKQTYNYMLYLEIQLFDIPITVLAKFAKFLRGFGYGLGLDSFVINSENLILMQEINPSYIKVHTSYLLDLFDEDKLSEPIKSLGIVTDSMDIKIIATNVEDKEQKEKLKKIGIRYIQGSFIEEPKLLR